MYVYSKSSNIAHSDTIIVLMYINVCEFKTVYYFIVQLVQLYRKFAESFSAIHDGCYMNKP